jgi:hypothetical protein
MSPLGPARNHHLRLLLLELERMPSTRRLTMAGARSRFSGMLQRDRITSSAFKHYPPLPPTFEDQEQTALPT